MRTSQNANAAFGAIAIALIGAITIVATPVAAAVSSASGLSEQKLEKPVATTKIAATKKKKKRRRRPAIPPARAARGNNGFDCIKFQACASFAHPHSANPVANFCGKYTNDKAKLVSQTR